MLGLSAPDAKIRGSALRPHPHPQPQTPLLLPSPLPLLPPSLLSSPPPAVDLAVNPKDIADSFKEWFLRRGEDASLFDSIFKILNTHDAAAALSRLSLCLPAHIVLGVLHHGRHQVLPCLKFFDWAGHQRGFHHTSATFHSIFKIIYCARLLSVIFDGLEVFARHRYTHRVRFYDTLVMGYLIAGTPQTALRLFRKMRFQGLDLDYFSYHVLLNALVEESYFEAGEAVSHLINLNV